jgi:hypothetical protein
LHRIQLRLPLRDLRNFSDNNVLRFGLTTNLGRAIVVSQETHYDTKLGVHCAQLPCLPKSIMSHATTGKRWIELRENDSETAGVLIRPANEDLFALPMAVAIRGCKLAGQIDRFNQQFERLLDRLYEWTLAHGDAIRQVYVGFPHDGLLFLVVQRGEHFDQNLEDDLTGLDVEIARNPDYDLIKLNVLALPNCSEETVRSFLPPNGSLTYEHAKRGGSPQSG